VGLLVFIFRNAETAKALWREGIAKKKGKFFVPTSRFRAFAVSEWFDDGDEFHLRIARKQLCFGTGEGTKARRIDGSFILRADVPAGPLMPSSLTHL
jgi:hypothetical protein